MTGAGLEKLAESLSDVMPALSVRPLGEQSVSLVVPTAVGGDIMFVVERRDDDTFAISDVGHTEFRLAESFDELLDLFDCLGAPFETNDVDKTLRATAESVHELRSVIPEFAHFLASADLLAAATRCTGTPPAASAARPIDVMARETRSQVLRADEAVAPFMRLNQQVSARSLTTTVPFVVGTFGRSNLPPKIVSHFVDFAAPARSRQAALKNASFAHDILDAYRSTQKYVVVRGADFDEFATVADVYDRRNIVALPSDNQDQLIDATVTAARELARI